MFRHLFKEYEEIILIILSCKKYRFKAEQQKRGWLRQMPQSLRYFHIEGDPTLNREYIFLDKENKLIVRTEDDYVSLPRKVMAAFYAIMQRFQFKYLWKTDDDQNCILSRPDIYFGNLQSSLLAAKKSSMPFHYGGNIIHVRKQHVSSYYTKHPELPKNLSIEPVSYCSGRFYFLSHTAIMYLLEFERKQIEGMFLEDYAIGRCLHQYYKSTMLHVESEAIFRDFAEYSQEAIEAGTEAEANEKVEEGTTIAKEISCGCRGWWPWCGYCGKLSAPPSNRYFFVSVRAGRGLLAAAIITAATVSLWRIPSLSSAVFSLGNFIDIGTKKGLQKLSSSF